MYVALSRAQRNSIQRGTEINITQLFTLSYLLDINLITNTVIYLNYVQTTKNYRFSYEDIEEFS